MANPERVTVAGAWCSQPRVLDAARRGQRAAGLPEVTQFEHVQFPWKAGSAEGQHLRFSRLEHAQTMHSREWDMHQLAEGSFVPA